MSLIIEHNVYSVALTTILDPSNSLSTNLIVYFWLISFFQSNLDCSCINILWNEFILFCLTWSFDTKYTNTLEWSISSINTFIISSKLSVDFIYCNNTWWEYFLWLLSEWPKFIATFIKIWFIIWSRLCLNIWIKIIMNWVMIRLTLFD